MFFTVVQLELDFRAPLPDVSDNLYMMWTPTYTDAVLKYICQSTREVAIVLAY